MWVVRLCLGIFLALRASYSFAEPVYLVDLDLIVKPFDGSQGIEDHVRARRVLASLTFDWGSEIISFGKCTGRYDCDFYIADVDGQKGKLVINITEYDSADIPSRVIWEVIADVDFALGKQTVYNATTVNSAIELSFTVDAGPEIASRDAFRPN